MFVKVLAVITTLFLAAVILFTSVFRSAAVRHAFSQSPDTTVIEESEKEEYVINYTLPYQGKILPDSPLWSIKALRDKLWLMVTTNPLKKAELKLLFSDKRLVSSRLLFEKEKAEIAFSTLSKGEKYLEEAMALELESREKGLDTSTFLLTLVNASLKHREMIDQITEIAPEDAKPGIIRIRDYSTNVYKGTRDALNEKGMIAPENPFNTN